MAPVSTLRPWKNGSNMDINELQEGSTIFIPVFLKGGLIWTGDSHCRQGNGEVNLTALECSYKEIRLQPIVRKDMKLEWPFIETRTHWITTGFHEDLNVAMTNATREAVELARQPEDGADGPLRGVQPRVDGGGLPRVAGGGRPQGRALHDPEVDLHEALLVTASAPSPPRRGEAAFGCSCWRWPPRRRDSVLAQQKLRVVATSPDLKSLVEAVGGARVEVESLAAPEQDPHAVEVKPAQLARVRDAALLVRVGLDHEPWLARLRAAERRSPSSTRRGTCAHPDANAAAARRAPRARPRLGNTHYWLDPANARPITADIRDALAEAEPRGCAGFRGEPQRLHRRRSSRKVREWKAALAPFRGTKLVVMHDSWSYFAEAFGLQIVAAAEPHPGVPPSPGRARGAVSAHARSRA